MTCPRSIFQLISALILFYLTLKTSVGVQVKLEEQKGLMHVHTKKTLK